jgi:hypothetical protein
MNIANDLGEIGRVRLSIFSSKGGRWYMGFIPSEKSPRTSLPSKNPVGFTTKSTTGRSTSILSLESSRQGGTQVGRTTGEPPSRKQNGVGHKRCDPSTSRVVEFEI